MIKKHENLTEADTAKIMAAMIINSRKKNAMNYYSSGAKALTGSGENKIKLEPRLEKVYTFYRLYLFSKLYIFFLDTKWS